MMVVSRSIQSFLLLNNLSFNPEVDFPLRYFDLTATSNIGETRLGEKCSVIATVSEIEEGQLFAVDTTGGILLKFYDTKLHGNFEAGQKIIFSGIVDAFDNQKCIKNPLVIVYVEGKYKEVIPVYPQDFEIDKKNIEDEGLRAIHGFSGKADLVEARQNLKQKQIDECKKACAENGSTVKRELLKPFANIDTYNKNVRLVTRFDEGEEAQAIKDAKNPLVICPLAHMSTERRNAKVYDFARYTKVPESCPHPNISIENDADCQGNFEGVKKRGTVLSELLYKNVETSETYSKPADLIVIEDADRISSLEIDYWMRQSQCDALIVSNSKKLMQLQRLRFLCEPHAQEEVLWHELSFRREGDILGCRNPIFKGLSLVKGTDLGFRC